MNNTETMFRYYGRSMWPCFQEGDLLDVNPVAVDEIRIGDCIAYRNLDGSMGAHRVVSLGKALRTRGDAMSTADKTPIAPDQFVGRIQSRYRYGQKSSVAGGVTGRLAAIFYRYAGRIDPERDSKGGSLARLIRRLSSTFQSMVPLNTRVETIQLHGNTELSILRFGKKIVGAKEASYDGWALSWPWVIMLEDMNSEMG